LHVFYTLLDSSAYATRLIHLASQFPTSTTPVSSTTPSRIIMLLPVFMSLIYS
jgi:hypothetical protein